MGPLLVALAVAFGGTRDHSPSPARNAARAGLCLAWIAADADMLIEDIAFDSAANRYLVTSVTRGGVYAIGRDGRMTTFIRSDTATWGTFAIGLDAARHTLWVTTFSYPGSARHTDGNAGQAAVLEYDYPGGALRRRWAPDDSGSHAIGDLAVAPNGDVYLTASIGGGIYVIDRARGTMRTLRSSHTFRSPQTPVVSRDGRALLIPDYPTGIARLDVLSGRVSWLTHDPALNLRGIDGMYALDGQLIAIQNGPDPNRILRLSLHGDSIAQADIVASGGEATDLNHAVIVNGEIRFIARSGWARMSGTGVMAPGSAAQAPRLLRICQ